MRNELKQLIISKAKEIHPKVVEWRRDFHAHPELGFEEVRTSKIVEDELKRLGYEVTRVAETGVIGTLKGGIDTGLTVALRADMDALPIQEENDVPYRSRVPGKMHACGHDAHTAMLLGAAHILAKIKDKIPGTIKLIFQPAEEIGTGAKRIVEEGHVNDVKAFFGMHVWSMLPSGVLSIKEGLLLASSDDFRISILGKGGHPSSPQYSIDPISVAVDIADAFYKIVTLEVDPLEPVVVAVTSIRAGNTYNVIPEKAEILGTVRAFSREVRDHIIERMKYIVKKYSEGMRCRSVFELLQSMPPTLNDPSLARTAVKVLEGFTVVTDIKPDMGSEDFSFYGEVAPSLYIELGVGNKDKGIIYPEHHPKFDVDEDALWVGTAVYAIMAIEFLEHLKQV